MLLSPRMQRKGGRPRTRSRTAPSVDGGVTRLSALTRRSKTRPSERNSAAAVETAHTDGVDTTQTVPVKLQQRSSVARGMVALGLQRSPVPPAFRLPLQLLRAVSTAAALDDEPEASPRHDESLRPSSSETRSPRRSSGSSPVKPLFRYDSKTKQYLRVLTPRDPLGVARQESIFAFSGCSVLLIQISCDRRHTTHGTVMAGGESLAASSRRVASLEEAHTCAALSHD